MNQSIINGFLILSIIHSLFMAGLFLSRKKPLMKVTKKVLLGISWVMIMFEIRY